MDKIVSNKKQVPSFFTRRSAIIIGALIVLVTSGMIAFYDYSHNLSFNYSVFAAPKTIASNGAEQWIGDQVVTVPRAPVMLSVSKEIAVSALFNQYYQRDGVGNSLGAPITDAFPTSYGWMQFFTSDALLLATPLARQAAVAKTDETLVALINNGIKDKTTGIVHLPLLQALLALGSKVPIGGAQSTLTYANLRQATNPNLMLPVPTTATKSSSQPIFLQGGTRRGKGVGHFVPQLFWRYMQRSDVAPNGWATDFGLPLTEAMPITITNNGKTQHLLVQAFERNGLIIDLNALDAANQPTIQRFSTGVDYLHTVGLPTVAVGIQHPAWAQGDASLLDTPDTGQTIAHIGQNFPLNLLGDTDWAAGVLWYHVQWSTLKSSRRGWISASAITFTSPGNVAGWASLDVISPELATYLSSLGSSVGVVLYDVKNRRYYTYNSNTQFIIASSMKVPIMLTYLDMLEQQGQEPNDDQMNLLTTMIENSNNDSASELYFNEIGGAVAVNNYMQKIGVSGLAPDADSWGYSLITPQAMVDLLTLLNDGKILNANDRSIALNLMQNIESDQKIGVGDTAPAGFTVAMKDGWVTGPDDLWAMNTSGILTASKATYIVSVYTQEQQSLDDGQGITQRVCSSVASLFV